VIATDRSAGRMTFNRIKHYLISTTDNYNTPLYWAGSSGTYMLTLSTALTAAKYNIEYSGYAFFMNTQTNKRQVIYEDFNTMINGSYTNTFSLPSSYDDEITGAFIYRQKLYIHTRYKIFKITFTGGNPDFDYKDIKDFGFVPGTVKIVNFKELGEVVMGLCWDKRVRIFDGSGDAIISDKIENDNKICEFALNKINDNQIANSFAEYDTRENFYKLGLCINPSTRITHIVCLNLRTGAWFPYKYTTPLLNMVMAESANAKYCMGIGYNGFCYMMDSGNTEDGTAINEHYDSPFLFKMSPKVVAKQQNISLFFVKTSSNTLKYYDAMDFDNIMRLRNSFQINTNVSSHQIEKITDIPITCNVYQWRITSDQGTSEPWILNRWDLANADYGVGKE
jgi:hypothetical protein